MKKLLGFCGLLFLAGNALGVTISSTTPNTNTLPSLFVQPYESISYSVTGTSTGTITLQKSFDGANFVNTSIQVIGTGPVNSTGKVSSDDKATFFRFNVSTITAGSFVTTISDLDDFVTEVKNRKHEPVMQLYDETLRMNRPLVQSASPTYSMSKTDTLTPHIIDKGFVILTSTGGAITVTSTPTISTATAVAGMIYIIQSTTATITLQDDGTLPGSALELGSSTRALGVGDIIGLIYRNSKWYELFFANN